jgi:hypothetical protein
MGGVRGSFDEPLTANAQEHGHWVGDIRPHALEEGMLEEEQTNTE